MEDHRQMCITCGQELAHSAYYRHLHDKTGRICPGKRQLLPFDASEEVDEEFNASSIADSPASSRSNPTSDSTVDFGSAGSAESCASVGSDNFHVPLEGQSLVENEEMFSDDDSISGFSSCETLESSSDGEEIWELSDSDIEDSIEDCDQAPSVTAKSLLFGVTLFVYFFHLFYRLSEKATVALLNFLRTLFSFVAGITQNRLMVEIAQSLPRSLCSIRKYFRQDGDIISYVVCPKCSRIYTVSSCIVKCSGRLVSKRCDHVEFPNHPSQSKRQSKCNALLMKTIKVRGKSKLIPRKVYVYKSIITSLTEMAKRPGFLKKCDHWRSRISDGYLADIYDGRIWKNMLHIDGRPFLAIPNNLCLTINIDWFNLYDDTQYSAGAIYLVILNLPRNERYKFENMVLVGMIPGPNEPVGDTNSYLSPLVNDLKSIFDGISFRNPSSFLKVTTIRATLTCISCDIPATRKVCGFASFNALKGCSKCLKEFPTAQFGSKPNYGGFDCQNWPPRDNVVHKEMAIKFRDAKTATARKDILKEYGAKYSKLLELPHLNLVRNHIIDPMHNMFLGIAKHTTKTWKEYGILNMTSYKAIQERVDMVNPPSKIGRIPRKIESGFTSFTADEWKHWILFYSLFALYGVLPEIHYKCWCIFVDCCRLLCLPLLTETQVNRAHSLLVEFCQTFENLYGAEHCTPNMHLACHLKESILDYGPLAAFWCYPFERYNGTLQRFQKSWVSPEKQMFLKFLDMQYMYTLESHSSNDTFVSMIVKSNELLRSSVGYSTSVNQSQQENWITLQQIANYDCEVSSIDASEKPFYRLLPPLKEKCFNDTDFRYLKQLYSLLYPTSNVTHVSRFYHQSKRMIIHNEEFISSGAKSQRSSAIAAHWADVSGIDSLGEAPIRIGMVSHFFTHQITLEKASNPGPTPVCHTFARVKWYMDHPRRNFLHPPMIVCATTFDYDTSACFIPVCRIIGRAAIIKTEFTFDFGIDHVIIAVPFMKYEL